MGLSSVTWQDPNVLLVEGEVDIGSVVDVREKGEQLIARAPAEFIVDIGGLNSAHSVILSLLLRWISFAGRQGKSFHLHRMPPKLFDVARVSGLETVLPLSDVDHFQAAP